MTCSSVKTKTNDRIANGVSEKRRHGPNDRLWERFVSEHGFENFSDAEILTTLLSCSYDAYSNLKLAEDLLDNFGSLKGVFEARPEQLMQLQGMTTKRAGLISLAIPIARTWIAGVNEETEKIRNSREAEEYCKKLLCGERVENFYVIAMNVNGKVIGQRKISTGSLSEVNAYPRLIMETALNYNASGIILCHNHPGGTDYPSQEDIRATVIVQKLLNRVGILLLDHIIVAGDKGYSMVKHGDISYVNQTESENETESKDPAPEDPREKNKACSRSKDKEVTVMPYNRKALGVVISKLRVEKGLTQETLSGLAGISRSHLAALENGEKTVKLDTLWRIADALGIGPAALIWKTEAESITLQREGSK